MKISDPLALGLWLTLESSVQEIERARALLRDPHRPPDACERVEEMLGRAWLRIDSARRALGPE